MVHANNEADALAAHDVRPDKVNHNEAGAFANGQGAILSRDDQALALHDLNRHQPIVGLPSHEDLLEQLSRDAKKLEADSSNSLVGLKSPHESEHQDNVRLEENHARELSSFGRRDQVQGLCPEQLKEIGELVNAAMGNREKLPRMKQENLPLDQRETNHNLVDGNSNF